MAVTRKRAIYRYLRYRSWSSRNWPLPAIPMENSPARLL